VVGAILAGGAGRRMGGGKAARLLGGRPLVAYSADALTAVCDRVAVVCKPGTELPPGPWEPWDDEPPEPRHPAAGIAHALDRAGEAVLVCAADMPFVTAAECRALAAAAAAGALTAVAVGEGGLEPLLGVYALSAANPLRAAAESGSPLRGAVESLDPIRVDLPSSALRSVNTLPDLTSAERELTGGQSP
jgi:molybdenum cofactor guanylyltransferase